MVWLALDPWNTTAERRPRGKTNWARKAVYAALPDFDASASCLDRARVAWRVAGRG